MNSANCPKCNELLSRKTVASARECNNCNAKRILAKYLSDEEFLFKKTKSKETGNYTILLINFLNKSALVPSQQNRIVVDFVKIMNLVKDHNARLSELWVHNSYFKVSAIKSRNALNIIKVFLYSEDLIAFDMVSDSFFPIETREIYRFKKDILDYFYSPTRCRDCGAESINSAQSFCYTCIAYRSIFNKTTLEYVNKEFPNNSLKGLYFNYTKFIATLGRTPQTLVNLLESGTRFIKFLTKYIPDNINTWPFKFNDNNLDLEAILESPDYTLLIEFKFSEEWRNIFLNEFKGEGITVFLAFLERIGLLSPLQSNPKEKILKKIYTVNQNFQKPLIKMLEKELASKELLEKKNAVIRKKMSTIIDKIDMMISFYNWLANNETAHNWAEVSERMVNTYLLQTPQRSRDIKKRALYNFFQFAKKQRFIFANPIENFIARDRMIEVRPLTKQDHSEIYRKLTTESDQLFVEKLISSLIYFHALQTKNIMEIKIEDIKLASKSIYLNGRPPVFLSTVEMLLLHLTLDERLRRLNGKNSIYLFCSHKSIKDVSIKKGTINQYVKSILGLPPKSLRIAALQFCASNFGAEYLHDCFGLSITQASRYANIGEVLMDDIINDEINNNKKTN
ncbi:hypothetical protein CEF21_16615 [Bacillus sp. FJAT-42376]|uniref:hypothetical protein n=1 Tax=Bacillus sp. FJAT-42376 TaxID=2014076 RepID=UPI000F4F14A3|nr:hypothetical protein [Bacillus sp. FJAT-42376]AZB43798.1 hypothetical protein CEF21_16615 [Bacillus sp. FJAT-42376]